MELACYFNYNFSEWPIQIKDVYFLYYYIIHINYIDIFVLHTGIFIYYKRLQITVLMRVMYCR